MLRVLVLSIENVLHRFQFKKMKQRSLTKMAIYISDMKNVKEWKKTEEFENPHSQSFFHKQLKLALPELQEALNTSFRTLIRFSDYFPHLYLLLHHEQMKYLYMQVCPHISYENLTFLRFQQTSLIRGRATMPESLLITTHSWSLWFSCK